jgi:hypothetical protein
MDVYLLDFVAQIVSGEFYVLSRAGWSWTEFVANSGKAYFSGPKAQRAIPSRARFSQAERRLAPSPTRDGSCPPLAPAARGRTWWAAARRRISPRSRGAHLRWCSCLPPSRDGARKKISLMHDSSLQPLLIKILSS